MPERRVIVFSGRVHGVGFRISAVHAAEGLALGGTVRNTEEGDVELIVEGEISEIDELVSRLREQFGSYIRNISQRSTIPSGALGRGIRVVF